MFNKILVPLDGSVLSESVLPQAVAIAEPSGSLITLFRVMEPLDKGVRDTMGSDLASKLDEVNQDEAMDYLAKIAAELKRQGLKAETAIVTGKPAEAIIEYIGTHAVDMVVMATHGRSGLSRWAFGSVTDKVLHQSPVPVLVGPVPGADRG
jgi:nucleotide-binding universal stress UspA family protein